MMLTFNLKKEWFNKIKSGEKTHEYRLFNGYWCDRLLYRKLPCLCVFACGYPAKSDKTRRLSAIIKNVTVINNGIYTDLKTNKPVLDIEFELIKEVDIGKIVGNTVHIQKIGDITVKDGE